MTADVLVGQKPEPERVHQPARPEPAGQQPPAGVAAMAKLVRDSFAVVEPHADQVAELFYATLFSIAPEVRDLFPVNMRVQRSRLLRALVHVVQLVDRQDDLIPFLRQLGRDHRKFDVVSEHYEAFGTALLAALKKFTGPVWTDEVERAWAEAYTIMARAMLDAAAADTSPAWWPATVLDHTKVRRDLAVIRVRPEQPVPHHAGQYLSVEIPQRPRLWRYLSPATAPREDGVLEFHVQAVDGGEVSRAMVLHAQPGDVWRLGPALGRIRVDRRQGRSARDVVMVAGGTGIAPMRAIIDELAQWGENPDVQLFFGGRTLADLYDLDHLRSVAAANPWLTVLPVLESAEHTAGVEQGTLADVVTRYGAWPDRSVLVAGSPAMIRATVSRMLVAGTPLDRITYDPFTVD